MSDRAAEIQRLADEACADDSKRSELIEKLGGSSRRERQIAAAAISAAAKEKPELFVENISDLIDALNRPEAQTRWECLEALTVLIEFDSRSCNKAIPEAEAALFDEDSGPVRLAAMRFLCKLGSTTSNRSEKVWPLIDEGIQCYHGDLEFDEMLAAINEFAQGKLSDEVKDALRARMSFDAENGKGSMKRKAQQVIAYLQ